MEKLLAMSVALSFFLIFLFTMAIIGFVIYFLRQKRPLFPDNIEDAVLPPKKFIPSRKVNKTKHEAVCINHPEERATGVCAICEESFCNSCLVNHNNLLFCHDHYKLFSGAEWEKVATVHTDPDHPEKGIFLYDLKKDLWGEAKTPTYIETHYKINFESDTIESFVILYGRKQDRENIDKRICH